MAFGLIVIGDEILSGKRTDKHFPKVVEIFAARGLALDWVSYLGDDRCRLTAALAHTFASGDTVFSCGGIGATPDDHTRQAAAAALELPLQPHEEAQRLIAERSAEVGLPVTPGRLQMGEFPLGAELIPNPVNRIAGFSICNHWFVPGFPDMAWPMIEWVLDTHYPYLFHQQPKAERALIVRGLAEATITPLMQDVEATWDGMRVFSLPRLNLAQPDNYVIELGVKGPPETVEAAFARLRSGVLELGGRVEALVD